MSDLDRPDPRLRPPDPAGTQPKVDPQSLLPEPVGGHDAVSARLDEPVQQPVEQLETGDDPHVEPPAQPPAPTETAHAPRFQFLYGALLALGLIAVAAAVLVFAGGDDERGGSNGGALTWSSWRPAGHDPLQEIANHVGAEYKGAAGRQLVSVKGDVLAQRGLPVVPAVPADRSAGTISILTGVGVEYRMCGFGQGCTLPGKRSLERGMLLSREALELALYTFHYLDVVDHVAVFLPHIPGSANPKRVLMFQRDDVGAELRRPLADTLTPATPSLKNVRRSPDLPVIQELAAARTFGFTLRSDAPDSYVLLLAPLKTERAAAKRRVAHP